MNSGVNSLVSHWCHVLDNALLRLHEPRSDDDRPHRPTREQPASGQPLGVHLDRGEHHHRKTSEYAPAEGDEHVVDDQLSREPHEVHASPVREPATSDVREADDQPQGDG